MALRRLDELRRRAPDENSTYAAQRDSNLKKGPAATLRHSGPLSHCGAGMSPIRRCGACAI